MNTLTAEMRRSLKELDLGLKGELTITSDMEDLSNALFFDQVCGYLIFDFEIFLSLKSTHILFLGSTCMDKESI